MIVAKFGGTSLSDAEQFKKVRDIFNSSAMRRYIVVSAPGKRFDQDQKVTDLLINLHQKARSGEPIDACFSLLRDRFDGISRDLNVPGCLDKEFETILDAVRSGASRDYIASRGEYLCGLLLSRWMNLPFIDAADVIRFRKNGRLDDQKTYRLLRSALLRHERAVLPGFYGSDKERNIVTFSRGGSDITGALAANAVDADLYENWTDITGFRSADPRIVPDASYISLLTYQELRELSYMGATVLHEDAVFPVRSAGIPTSIRNTMNPLHPGTTIQQSTRQQSKAPTVTGIAGKRGFSVIVMEKDRMNDEIGFGRKVLSILERHRINFEHLPTGIDAMCVMVSSSALGNEREQIIKEIEDAVHPDNISIQDGLALVDCVGAGVFKQHGTIARLFSAVSEQGITIRTMFQAPSDLSIIIGIAEEDMNRAVNAIYDA